MVSIDDLAVIGVQNLLSVLYTIMKTQMSDGARVEYSEPSHYLLHNVRTATHDYPYLELI